MNIQKYWLIPAFFLVIQSCNTKKVETAKLISYVDPFIGVDNEGMTLPGPTLPFSMARPGPDCPIPNWTTGYRSYKPIDGFSQNHLSGTGGPGRFGNFLVIPESDSIITDNYSSAKSDEKASPGYYTVFLNRWGVKAELTTAERCTFHKYTFPQNKKANILIDASRLVYPEWKDVNDPKVVNCEMHFRDSATIEGMGEFIGGWGHFYPYKFYIVIKFDRPFKGYGLWSNDSLFAARGQISGKKIGAYVSFDNSNNNTVQMKAGISYKGYENAEKNLGQVQGWDFGQVAGNAESIWEGILNKIVVSGGTEEQKKIFYTSIYRSFAMPTDITGDNPKWDSDSPQYWDYYCIWDTYRTLHPLFTLIAKEKQVEMLQSLLDIYDHYGWVPDAWIVGEAAYIQGGTNSDVLFADALIKGLKGIDYDKAYKAMLKNATIQPDKPQFYGRHIDEYNTLGYCSDKIFCGSSKTLEYAYNDFCIAQTASILGKPDDYEKYLNQSSRWKNLFNDSTKFFWAKDKNGKWVDGFIPAFMKEKPYEGPYFYEGTPWHYSTYVPHDVQGLIKKHGGKEQFVAFLDTMFETGEYTQTNQPDLLTPYLYNYAGRPDRTAERVRHILATEYKATVDGLPGNDDAGCMSSWYVFGAMGFYPNAGQDVYLIGSPVFEIITLNLGDSNFFKIIAKNNSKINIYVRSAKLNGKVWDKNWFRHKDIVNGGVLELEMGDAPSGWGRGTPPPSVSLE